MGEIAWVPAEASPKALLGRGLELAVERLEVATQRVPDEIARYAKDPLGYVEDRFPWGKGPLAGHPGPDDWQRDLLARIGARLREHGDDPEEIARVVIQEAVSSGHGIGKSAVVAMILCWAMDTRPDTRGVVTANTDTQLKTKTWPELTKWFRLGGLDERFTLTATAMFSKLPGHERTWRIDAIPWSENRPEAFAGLHNEGGRTVIVFDEASAIPDVIWETASGALTDQNAEVLWLAFGNPTRNTGRFRECFGRFRHRWHTTKIDSRTCRVSNKELLNQWVEDYGEDSDFVRVRVRGEFPRAGSMQFISSEAAEAARSRPLPEQPQGPEYRCLLLGVDVARFGDDQSVIYFRDRRDGRRPPLKFRGIDTMALAARVAQLIDQYHPAAVFVDGGGVGGGVVDRLRQLGHRVIDVNFGGKADDPDRYANKRAEMWDRMREWIESGGCIAEDDELLADLTGVEYGFDAKNRLVLEKKEDMKRRGLASPDVADALALTFAYPVGRVGRKRRPVVAKLGGV